MRHPLVEWPKALSRTVARTAVITATASVVALAVIGCGSPVGDDISSLADVRELAATVQDQEVTLTWVDPSSEDLDRIEVSWTPADGVSQPQTVSPGTEAATIGGLENAVEYSFTVRAVDSSGNVSDGVSIDAAPLDTVPPPDVTDLTAAAQDRAVQLSWIASPANDLDRIEVSWTPADGVSQPQTVSPGTEAATIGGLENAVEYSFTVRAVDSSGNVSDGVSIDAAPRDASGISNVTALSVVSGDSSVTLQWNPPSGDGTDGLQITWIPADGEAQPKTVVPGLGEATITGLVNGTSYTFTVKAVDSAGNTSAGVDVSATPQDTTSPNGITSVSATAGEKTATLQWSDPDDDDLDHIEITWSPLDGEVQPKTVVPGLGEATITGLVNGTSYTFTVKAVDSAGNTSAGVDVGATPQDTTPPTELSDLSWTSQSSSAQLIWSAPADPDLDHVQVSWTPADGGSQPIIVPASIENLLVAGLSSGATYSFTLRTVDEAGNESVGNSVDVGPVSDIPKMDAGTNERFEASGINWDLRFLPPKSVPTGPYDSGSTTVHYGFFIAETEVTYQLWYEVYQWAISNGGYIFANPGREGSSTNDGAEPTASKLEPVTFISWRDAMVWTNALTEWYNAQTGSSLEPVYWSDANFTSPIRTVDDNSVIDYPNPGSQDDPVTKPGADGFRLPSSAEWSLAARWIGDANDDGDIRDPGEYYPGNHASGADGAAGDTHPDFDLDADGDVDDTRDVAVYRTSTIDPFDMLTVGWKKPNALGLFDMSGNAEELVFSWSSSSVGSSRVARGDSVSDYPDQMYLGTYTAIGPHIAAWYVGFRVARTP